MSNFREALTITTAITTRSPGCLALGTLSNGISTPSCSNTSANWPYFETASMFDPPSCCHVAPHYFRSSCG